MGLKPWAPNPKIVQLAAAPATGDAPFYNGTEWLPGEGLELVGAPAANDVAIYNGTEWSPATLGIGQVAGINPASAYRAAVLALAVGYNKIPVDTLNFDTTPPNFDVTTNHRYDIPATGRYAVMAEISANYSVAPTGALIASLWKNGGTEIRRGSRLILASVGIYSVNLACFADCATGDYLELYVYTGAAGTLDVATTNNYFDVARLA